MAHTFYIAEAVHHAVVHANGCGKVVLDRLELRHDDVAAKTRHLVADGVFEPYHHTHRHYHHCQTYRHTERGDTDGRTAHLAAAFRVLIDAAGDEQGKTHDCCSEILRPG